MNRELQPEKRKKRENIFYDLDQIGLQLTLIFDKYKDKEKKHPHEYDLDFDIEARGDILQLEEFKSIIRFELHSLVEKGSEKNREVDELLDLLNTTSKLQKMIEILNA